MNANSQKFSSSGVHLCWFARSCINTFRFCCLCCKLWFAISFLMNSQMYDVGTERKLLRAKDWFSMKFHRTETVYIRLYQVWNAFPKMWENYIFQMVKMGTSERIKSIRNMWYEFDNTHIHAWRSDKAEQKRKMYSEGSNQMKIRQT